MSYLLVIDQGTTSTRAIASNSQGHFITSQQLEFQQIYPEKGWVEHHPEEIWETVVSCCNTVIQKMSSKSKEIAAMGITNQRETTLIWEKKTGKCIANAIVWQDRRTADYCLQLKKQGLEPIIYKKTGLLLDPYFSASKLYWLLNTIPKAMDSAKKGDLLFGTIDCYLLWRLTEGKTHATDITNASRTMLFNIQTLTWDDELLDIFAIPKQILPEVKDNCVKFGVTTKRIFGKEIPILGMIGDQQAAMLGQACISPWTMKITYGTGAFLMMNTGSEIIRSSSFISTIAYRINNEFCYALEGSIFSAGLIIKWLRDQMHLITNSAESESIAQSLDNNGGVYLVPAFTGLGAPYWNAFARGEIHGLTRDTTSAHIIRAGLEAIAYQTQDLLVTLQQEEKISLQELRVDGGLTTNNWLMQFIADILQIRIQRSKTVQTTALGAIYLTALGLGDISRIEQITSLWQSDKTFYPQRSITEVNELYQLWVKAINKTNS